MATFDTSNPPAEPDSYLDPAAALERTYIFEDGSTHPISPGDWVDVVEYVGIYDKINGYSFQVCNLYDEAVGVLVSSDGGETYAETQLSACCITNTFRRM
jgi:hypothetical protein